MKVSKPDEFPVNQPTTPILPEFTYTSDHLPSKGIYYPANFLVKVRPYTFGEIEYISQSTLTYQDQIKFILQGVTVEGMEKDQLTFFDFLFLATVRKLISLGLEKYQLEAQCPNCGAQAKRVFTLEDLDFQEPQVSSYKPIRLEYNGITLTLDVLRIGRILSLPPRETEPSLSEILALHIVSMDFDKALNFIKSLPEFSFEEFQLILDKYFYHDLKPLPIQCPQCGNQFYVDIERRIDLVKPFRETRTASSFKILDS